MSRPREIGWGYAKAVIREYPTLQEEYKDLHSQSLTANCSDLPRAGSASRTTENIATRELSPVKQRRYDAVRQAIETTERCRNSRDRLRVIDLVFWKKSHTIAGAALMVHCCERTAQQWHADFVRMVAENLGVADS